MWHLNILWFVISAHDLFITKIWILNLNISFSTLVLREQDPLVPWIQIVICLLCHRITHIWSRIHKVNTIYRFSGLLIRLSHRVLVYLLKVHRWLLFQILTDTSHTFICLDLTVFINIWRRHIRVVCIPIHSLSEDGIFCTYLLYILPI